MRISHFYTSQIGPLTAKNHDLFSVEFLEDQETVPVLVSGPIGSGKSTLLRALAYLWQGLGLLCSEHPPEYPGWLNCAARFEGIWNDPVLIVLASDNEFLDSFGDLPIIGWQNTSGNCVPFYRNTSSAWLSKGNYSNMVFLDTETDDKLQPDWVPMHWLVTDELVINQFLRQPDNLITQLKLSSAKAFDELSIHYRDLLPGKHLEFDQDKPYIRLENGIKHPLRQLSRGERTQLFLLYTSIALLQPNGILMLDHPDVHLHPEQVEATLSAIEYIVQQKQAQFILTSHQQDAWRRYDELGIRIRMENRI